MNRILALLILFILLMPAKYTFAGQSESSFSLNGGYFTPRMDGWENHFDDSSIWTGGMEFGSKLTERLELSLGLNYSKVEGTSTTLTGRTSADKATYEQIPIQLSISYRFLFDEDQVIVPYIGGGYTHLIYREEINDNKISGDLAGYHARGGLQVLLDYFDSETAKDFSSDWEVINTYLTFEAIYSKVDDFGKKDTDLGGLGYMAGLRFEY